MDNPVNMPDPGTIQEIMEPTLKASMHIPNASMGDMLALVMEKRGVVEHTHTLDSTRVMLSCVLPLNEILVDFNDRLKSITHGYGSMDYELGEYRAADLVKMEILVNGDPVDAFASIVHRDKAEARGRDLCKRLSEIIPPQMFRIAHPGRDRRQDHRARERARDAQGRHGKVLRRRHLPQAQVARQAEGGKAEDEADRQGLDPSRHLHQGAQEQLTDPPRPRHVRTLRIHRKRRCVTTHPTGWSWRQGVELQEGQADGPGVRRAGGAHRDLKQLLKNRADAARLKLGIESLEGVLVRAGGAIYPKTSLVENIEFFLVAAIVILGIRTYFVQPFKIPTNSMWPTYYGMTKENFPPGAAAPNMPEKVFRFLAYGAQPRIAVAPQDGQVSVPLVRRGDTWTLAYTIRQGRSWLVLPTKVKEYTFYVDGATSTLQVPVDFSDVRRRRL